MAELAGGSLLSKMGSSVRENLGMGPENTGQARMRFLWTFRGTQMIGIVGTAVGVWSMMGPSIGEGLSAMFHYDRPTQQPDLLMPTLSLLWWTNEWRKGAQTWRRGEYEPGFWVAPLEWVKECTGTDAINMPRARLAAAKPKPQAAPEAPAAVAVPVTLVTPKKPWWKFWGGAPKPVPAPVVPAATTPTTMVPPTAARSNAALDETKAAADQWHADEDVPQADKNVARALVPMSGDSPIVAQLARLGYYTDAVDGCDVAIRSLAEKTEDLLGDTDPGTIRNMHLHYSDIFEPKIWQSDLAVGGYDLIYDRQGLSAMEPASLEDYAFVLKKALKPEGVLYTEGTFRTNKVPRNRTGGPPFHFGMDQLVQLFPMSQGWVVKCKELKEIRTRDLDVESRITNVIPRELQVRHFPCAVWRDEGLARKMMDEAQAREFA